MNSRHFKSQWTVSELTENDVSEVRALFQTVFDETMSADHWQWKYGENRGLGMLVKNATETVAFYGAIKRDIAYFGDMVAGLQVVDTMVKKTDRGTLARNGPYFRAASAFLENYVGFLRPFLLAYGFPNARVMRLGEILGIQKPVGEIVEPDWSVETLNGKIDYLALDFTNTQHAQIVQQLWQQMRSGLRDAIVGDRSMAYIRHRYGQNPLHQYHMEFVYDEGNIVGLLVTREVHDRLFLMDLVAAPKQFPILIQRARQQASMLGKSSLYAWISESYLALLGEQHRNLVRLNVKIPTSVYTDGPAPEKLQDKWWLMAGDTDFL